MGRDRAHNLAWQRERYRRDPSDKKARAKAWRLANPERYRENARRYRARNRERTRAYMREYRARDMTPWIIAYQLRRARLLGAEIGATPKLSLFDFSNVCSYCGAYNASGLDHVVPLSRGGDHSPENVVPACISCNQRKNNKPLLIFLLKQAA
jgi:5-methylcytosine-specific restriction endonuclease McrA